MKRDSADAAPRPYRSPLRERQAAQTRELILRALSEVVMAGGPRAISIAEVAQRADIAERTVYRHFPSVPALIAGLSDWIGAQLDEHVGSRRPLDAGADDASIEEAIEGLVPLFSAFDAIGTPIRAWDKILAAEGADERRREREQTLRRLLARDLGHLDRETADAAFAVIRHLGSAHTWSILTASGAVSGDQAGRLVQRTIRALLDDLRRQATSLPDEQAVPRPVGT